MGNQIIMYAFNGHPIGFDLSDPNLPVNATEMANVFKKRTALYLENERTKELIKAIVQDRNSDLELRDFVTGNPVDMQESDVVRIVYGGRNSGTWMHRLLAIDFAGWLHPPFQIWMLKTIDGILSGKLPYHHRQQEEKYLVDVKRMDELTLMKLAIRKEQAQIKARMAEYLLTGRMMPDMPQSLRLPADPLTATPPKPPISTVQPGQAQFDVGPMSFFKAGTGHLESIRAENSTPSPFYRQFTGDKTSSVNAIREMLERWSTRNGYIYNPVELRTASQQKRIVQKANELIQNKQGVWSASGESKVMEFIYLQTAGAKINPREAAN